MEMTDIQVVKNVEVSVPIRGLFNLTITEIDHLCFILSLNVSVPIRGLFNLTVLIFLAKVKKTKRSFRPHQGII